MAALTKGRNTPARHPDRREFPVAAATVIYAGAMAALDASGNLVPAAANAALNVVGRAHDTVDNSAGIAGAASCAVDAGVFRYNNSAGADLIATTDIGATCYAVDDQTVAKTSATSSRPAAGTIFDVDANGVWVRF